MINAITIIKKKRRKGYQRKRGHRQDLTLLQIQSISAAKTKKTAKKPAAKKPAEKKPRKPRKKKKDGNSSE